MLAQIFTVSGACLRIVGHLVTGAATIYFFDKAYKFDFTTLTFVESDPFDKLFLLMALIYSSIDYMSVP